MSKINILCIDCSSENLIMMNANMLWDADEQAWEYDDNPSPEFYCTDCMMVNVDYKEVPSTAEGEVEK